MPTKSQCGRRADTRIFAYTQLLSTLIFDHPLEIKHLSEKAFTPKFFFQNFKFYSKNLKVQTKSWGISQPERNNRNMQGDEARVLLGFPPNSRPNASQVLLFIYLFSFFQFWFHHWSSLYFIETENIRVYVLSLIGHYDQWINWTHSTISFD